MVCVLQDCNCGDCAYDKQVLGLDFTNKEVVFGGVICNCPCHYLKGNELTAFLANKMYLGENYEKQK